MKFVASPTFYLVSAFEESVKDRPEPAGIDELRVETERRELEMRMPEARVAQELAIARRIETAHEVEMTEYFEYAGKGHIGMSAEGETFSIGAGGSGRRVSKRKFVFKGHPDLAQIESTLERSQDSAQAVEKV